MASDQTKPEKPQGQLPVAKPLVPEAPPTSKPGSAKPQRKGREQKVTLDPDAVPEDTRWFDAFTWRSVAGFLISLSLHALILVVLSLLVWIIPKSEQFTLIVSTDPGDSITPGQLDDEARFAPDSTIIDASDSLSELSSELPLVDSPDQVEARQNESWTSDSMVASMPDGMLMRARSPTGGGCQGRSGDRRGSRLAQGGGNATSEEAVALGLEWLAIHQQQNGSWRFDVLGDDRCNCRNPGTNGSTTGATGPALLPFLGAGHTHKEGDYKEVVHDGLYYLTNRMEITPHGGDLREGTMYCHGVAATALCEAYAMTGDENMRSAAQKAVDYICWAQHSGGGWRYYPGQPGDTTVFGWQMMALKSAYMAGLSVPSPVIELANRYLDSVQLGKGAFYGYMTRARTPTPTAVGLLIRMYLGWNQDDPRLARGVSFLMDEGPSRKDMYFNYYATQVLHHYGGENWPKWNVPMRDYLIATQATTGHERGSWFFVDQHGVVGGRLYTTAVCIMILEVYYRHMPLYGEEAMDEDF